VGTISKNKNVKLASNMRLISIVVLVF